MGIKRWVANQDNTITNAFAPNLLTRGVSGNMGQSDVLEVFSIFGQASSASSELERILIQFPITEISSSRDAGIIPVSSSVDFYLRMFNAKHSWTTPRDYTLDVCPVSRSWCEGLGLDMEDYSDLDASNWLHSCKGTRACLTLTVEHTGGFNPAVPTTTVALYDGPYFTDQTDLFSGTPDPLSLSTDRFYLGLSHEECATNIANIINASASATHIASAEGDVVTICWREAGIIGNDKTVGVRPGHESDPTPFATLTGSTDFGGSPECIDSAPDQKICIAALEGGAQSGGTVPISWTAEGGDYLSSLCFSQSFDAGSEDLEVNITPLVEEWISGTIPWFGGIEPHDALPNYGVGIKLSAGDEGYNRSYYTKMFFARGSQFFFKRPIIEARWNSSILDDRGNFFLSSSLVPASDNLMNLYLYNVVRGQLTNIPAVDTGKILVSVYSGSNDNSTPLGSKLALPPGGGVLASDPFNITGSFVETGVYSASFAYTSSAITTIFDVWHSASIEYHTGSGITINTFDSQNFNFDRRYVSKIINLRPVYSPDETSRFRLYVREKDWQPTIYTVSSNIMPNKIIYNAYYQATRISDNLEVIPYGTGSLNHTKLSYDVSGSYFDLDLGLFDTDTAYSLKFVYLINGLFVEQPEEFRFRVE